MASHGSETILLQPRPYAQQPGKLLLLPLLPFRKPLKALPVEIWGNIFAFAVARGGREAMVWALSYLTVCKPLYDVALPVLYSKVTFSSMGDLERLYHRLITADRKWDSIRRIPYSTPGRWVSELDLSNLTFEGVKQTLHLDGLLTSLFPLTPFLRRLSVNPSFVMSRRVLQSLAQREGAIYLRSLEGFSYFRPSSRLPEEDPFVQLLQHCTNIDVLEIVGQGVDPSDLESTVEAPSVEDETQTYPRELDNSLNLSNLHTLTLLSMHHSPLMLALLNSPLPSLRKLTLTPYNDIPYPISLASEFIRTHGKNLRSLLLSTPKSWPTRLHPSPADLLYSCPNLQHLSLENPLPPLTLSESHSLQIISIPRPNPDFWEILDKMLHHLPHLHVLRTKGVRKLKKGLSSKAQEAGIQGEIKEWRRRLLRRGVRVIDADWNEFD